MQINTTIIKIKRSNVTKNNSIKFQIKSTIKIDYYTIKNKQAAKYVQTVNVALQTHRK